MKEKRILLKLSGEALAGDKKTGFDESTVLEIAAQVKKIHDLGAQVGVVIGGGNFWRGRSSENMDRTKADQIGMLATVMNCIYVSEMFRSTGMKTAILTPFMCGSVTELFSKDLANRYFEDGTVVFFAGGTGHPYFSTDTGIVLRAIEMDADAIYLAKAIDGVYDSDPKTNPAAKKYDEISIDEVINKKLAVIDMTASVMCMEHKMPLVVFGLNEKESIVNTYNGNFNGLLEGNFGYSDFYRTDVINVVKEPMKNTIFINVFATILALAITIPLGIRCAVKRGKLGDKTMQVLTIIGYSLPTFLISIIFIWIFCSLLGWLPPYGMGTPGGQYTGMKWFLDRAYYLILPLAVMTFCSLGGMTRYVRASMIDALSMDCIKTARAKGLREKTIIYSHAWRNALIPIVTLVVGWFLSIFSGSVVIEQIFAINGMGKIMITALQSGDNDVILLMQMFYVIIALGGNLVIDIIYGLVDPRVRVNK